MEFCPTCGMLLMYELPHLARPARFYCPTCPYVCNIENKVKIKRKEHLVQKQVDAVESADDFKNAQKTDQAHCPNCGHNEATFVQIQIRSADEPMSIIYRCMRCKHTHKED